MTKIDKFSKCFPYIVFVLVIIFSYIFMQKFFLGNFINELKNDTLRTILLSVIHLNSTYIFYIFFFGLVFDRDTKFIRLIIVYIIILGLSFLTTSVTHNIYRVPFGDSKGDLVYKAIQIVNLIYISFLMFIFSSINHIVRFLKLVS